MKVHLIKKQTLESFAQNNASSRTGMDNWYSLLKSADWEYPSDIIQTYNSADILGNGSNRVVFNISGNRFRLICKYHFGENMVHLFIKWVGTHAEYSTLCQQGKQYDISLY